MSCTSVRVRRAALLSTWESKVITTAKPSACWPGSWLLAVALVGQGLILQHSAASCCSTAASGLREWGSSCCTAEYRRCLLPARGVLATIGIGAYKSPNSGPVFHPSGCWKARARKPPWRCWKLQLPEAQFPDLKASGRGTRKS